MSTLGIKYRGQRCQTATCGFLAVSVRRSLASGDGRISPTSRYPYATGQCTSVTMVRFSTSRRNKICFHECIAVLARRTIGTNPLKIYYTGRHE